MKPEDDLVRMSEYIARQMSSYHLLLTSPFAILKNGEVVEFVYKWVSEEKEKQFNELGEHLKRINTEITTIRHERYLAEKEEYERNKRSNY